MSKEADRINGSLFFYPEFRLLGDTERRVCVINIAFGEL